jgi:hypothetical protein
MSAQKVGAQSGSVLFTRRRDDADVHTAAFAATCTEGTDSLFRIPYKESHTWE